MRDCPRRSAGSKLLISNAVNCFVGCVAEAPGGVVDQRVPFPTVLETRV